MTRGRRRLLVVSEDKQQETFSRRALMRFGYRRHELSFATAPSGRGAGEQFVRTRYARELRIVRGTTYQRVGLVVMVDADTSTVQERSNQLAGELAGSSLPPRTDDDPVAIVVPRRSIETWIHYL